MAVTFPMDYATLAANATKKAIFTAQVARSVAAAAQVPDSWVLVSNLRAGSVMADVSIQHPPGTSNEALAASGAAIASDPDSVFQTVKATFNITAPVRATVTAIQQPPSAAKASSASGPPSIGVGRAAGAAVGALIVLAAAGAAAIWARRRRARVQEEAPVAIEADTPVVSMHPSATGGVHAAAWPPGTVANMHGELVVARPNPMATQAAGRVLAQPRRRVAGGPEGAGMPSPRWLEQPMQLEEFDTGAALPGVAGPHQQVRAAAGLRGDATRNQAFWDDSGAS